LELLVLRYLSLLADHEDLGILVGFVVCAGSFACLRPCQFRGFVGPVVFQLGAMPRLRGLDLWLSEGWAREIASSYGGALDLGIGNLASLQEVFVSLDYSEAASDELVAALKHAFNIHPNHPQLRINGKLVESTGVLPYLP